jgi:hypothetical protein
VINIQVYLLFSKCFNKKSCALSEARLQVHRWWHIWNTASLLMEFPDIFTILDTNFLFKIQIFSDIFSRFKYSLVPQLEAFQVLSYIYSNILMQNKPVIFLEFLVGGFFCQPSSGRIVWISLSRLFLLD